MKKSMIILTPLVIIIMAVLIRLFPHAPNFTPIGAMALFGGVYLRKKYSIGIVVLALIISDYLLLYINPFSPAPLNFSQFYWPTALIHSTTVFVYVGILLNSLLGIVLTNRKSAANVIFASLFGSIAFFLITNFGVWFMGAYSRDISGLWQSYVMGLPFFRNTLMGDMFYVTVFFGGFELVKNFLLRQKIATGKSQ